MSAGKATLITGIVVGATTGFVLGHLTLWSHVSSTQAAPPDHKTASFPDDFNPLLPEIDLWNPIHSPRLPGEVYYSSVADSQVHTGEGTGPIDVSPPDEHAPPSFLPPPDASPIGTDVGFDLRTAIEREAPNLSEQELDVWLDVLNGLSEDDALGILRMWQLNGGALPLGVESSLSGPSDGAADLNIEPPTTTEEDPFANIGQASASGEHEVLTQFRGITLHNIANAETPGYRSLVPIVSNQVFPPAADDAADGYGIRLERMTLSIAEGPLVETGEQWDVAIRLQPNLFFKLQHAGELALTRYGHFRVDEQHRLSIVANGRSWTLDPEVVLPENVARIRIETDGNVHTRRAEDTEFSHIGRIELVEVHSPRSLQPIGDRLYGVTDPLGISHEPSESSGLAQGFIEGSNVDLTVERNRLAWIEELLRLGH